MAWNRHEGFRKHFVIEKKQKLMWSKKKNILKVTRETLYKLYILTAQNEKKLTFFQKFSFPNFLSFLSKQQAPIISACRLSSTARLLSVKEVSPGLTTTWVKSTESEHTDAGKRHSSSDSLWAVKSD